MSEKQNARNGKQSGASEVSHEVLKIGFCLGFPHTLSGPVIFLPLFICIREPSVCHMVSIRKRENPGNESLCVAAITLLGCCRLANYFDLFSWCN